MDNELRGIIKTENLKDRILEKLLVKLCWDFCNTKRCLIPDRFPAVDVCCFYYYLTPKLLAHFRNDYNIMVL